MMNRSIVFVLFTLMLFTCNSTDTLVIDYNIGVTSAHFCAYDDDLNIIWKVDNDDYLLTHYGDNFFVALKDTVVIGLSKQNGKKLWQNKVQGEMMAWGHRPLKEGMERDDNIVWYKFKDYGKLRDYWFDMTTGELLQKEVVDIPVEPKTERPRNYSSVLCVARLEDEIYVNDTKKYLFAFNKDFSLRWKQPIDSTLHLSGMKPDEAFVIGEYEFRVYDKFSGKLLLQKVTVGRIKRVMPGSDDSIRVMYEDGEIEAYAYTPVLE